MVFLPRKTNFISITIEVTGTVELVKCVFLLHGSDIILLIYHSNDVKFPELSQLIVWVSILVTVNMAVVFSSVLDPGRGPLRSQLSLDFVAIGVPERPLLMFPWTSL